MSEHAPNKLPFMASRLTPERVEVRLANEH
jgi:hypothetical protein